MEDKIDKFKGVCNKQLKAVGSIRRKLMKTRSLSASTDITSGYDDPDLDHLLENTDKVKSCDQFSIFCAFWHFVVVGVEVTLFCPSFSEIPFLIAFVFYACWDVDLLVS